MKKMTLQDVLAARQAISQEAVMSLHGASAPILAFVNFAKKATTLVQERINGIRTYLTPKGTKPNTEVKPNYDNYFTFAANTRYGDVKLMSIQVPEGFKGNYAEYAQTLRKAADLCYLDFVSRMVTPFDIHISRLINEPILLTSTTYRHNVQIKDIEQHKKALAKFFTGRKHTRLPLNEVFARNADIKTLAEELQLLSRLNSNQDVRDTLSRIDELNKRILKLIEIITDKTNNVNVSPKTLDELSHLVFELAKQTEFYAVIDSMLNTLLYASEINNNAFKARLANQNALEALTDGNQLVNKGLIDYLSSNAS